MKNLSTTVLFLLITTAALSACGSAPTTTPTIDSAAMHNTAIAAAFTVIAETHAAQPTETSFPPTEIPTETLAVTNTPTNIANTSTPAFTSTPEPTSTFTPAPTVQANTSCNNVLGTSHDNRNIQLKVRNKTRYDISVTVFLNVTEFGECGYRAYSLPQGQEVYISNLPYGCYSLSSYINDPRGVKASYGYGCANNPDVWWAEVFEDKITFNSP